MESLDLSHNQITHVEGLEHLANLSTLNLGEYIPLCSDSPAQYLPHRSQSTGPVYSFRCNAKFTGTSCLAQPPGDARPVNVPAFALVLCRRKPNPDTVAFEEAQCRSTGISQLAGSRRLRLEPVLR